MAVQLNVNSYVTVETADAFFLNRIDVAAWQDASADQKAQSLITATQMLDDLTWAGTAVSVSQPLAFPRISEYFDPKVGSIVYLNGTKVPDRIIRATLELAYHLLNNDGLLDATGDFKSISVGTIKIEGIQSASKMPLVIKNVIKPLLVNAGASAWWRAN